MLGKLASVSASAPRRVLILGLLVVLIAAGLAGSVAKSLEAGLSTFEDPSSQSAKAGNAFFAGLGVNPDASVVAIVQPRAKVSTPAGRAEVGAVASRLAADPGIATVQSFASTHDPGLLSKDLRSTYLVAGLASRSESANRETVERLQSEFESDPAVTLGGNAVADVEITETVTEDLKRAEMIVFPLLFLLLLRVFRGAVAALLPLIIGLVTIVCAAAGLRIASEATDISVYALNLTTGLGLGLAIDYSLLMVSRYREQLERHGPGAAAIRGTLTTAGRTVMFSSLTVGLALASLLIFPVPFLYSMGVAGILVALISGATALVLLPAILVVLGPRVNALSPKRWRVSESAPESAPSPAWSRIAKGVMRRPALIAALSTAALLAVGLALPRIQFTWGGAKVLPDHTSAREADTRLKRDFGANPTAPITVIGEVERVRGSRVAAARLTTRMRELPGAVNVTPVRPTGDPNVLVGTISSRGDPVSEASQRLVREARQIRSPLEPVVGGYTAQFIDLKDSIVRYLPLALGWIALSTFLLMFAMTQSVLLPLKTLLMNALTVIATLGALVLIFQDGRFERILGFHGEGAIGTTEPVVLVVLTFALSTDYAIFLLSRIKEEHDRGAPDRQAVAVGLERTGRIVTAAALLFALAIGAIAISHNIYVKELGIGAAIAVIIDATIVRVLLVPSLMALLGRWNWWCPEAVRLRLERWTRIGPEETG
jgi:RND superfamily putative drug exporter